MDGCDINETHFLSLHIQVKYNSTEKIHPLKDSNLYCFLKMIELVGFEFVNHSVSTFIFILNKDYFNFSEGKKWTITSIEENTTELPTKLFHLIQKYILLREELNLNSGSTEYKIDISFYPLSTQRSTSFSFWYQNRKQNTKLFLVGDAALSLPYFRGLNFGFYSSILLTSFIASNQDYKYNKKMRIESDKEIIKSEEFTGFIHMLNLYFMVANNNLHFVSFDESILKKLNSLKEFF